MMEQVGVDIGELDVGSASMQSLDYFEWYGNILHNNWGKKNEFNNINNTIIRVLFILPTIQYKYCCIVTCYLLLRIIRAWVSFRLYYSFIITPPS